MPNIKSAIKRVGVNQKKNLENKMIKSKIQTYAKKFKSEIVSENLEQAEKTFREVVAYMDSAASENVIHKNYASRKQAHFAKMLDDAKKK